MVKLQVTCPTPDSTVAALRALKQIPGVEIGVEGRSKDYLADVVFALLEDDGPKARGRRPAGRTAKPGAAGAANGPAICAVCKEPLLQTPKALAQREWPLCPKHACRWTQASGKNGKWTKKADDFDRWVEKQKAKASAKSNASA